MFLAMLRFYGEMKSTSDINKLERPPHGDKNAEVEKLRDEEHCEEHCEEQLQPQTHSPLHRSVEEAQIRSGSLGLFCGDQPAAKKAKVSKKIRVFENGNGHLIHSGPPVKTCSRLQVKYGCHAGSTRDFRAQTQFHGPNGS